MPIGPRRKLTAHSIYSFRDLFITDRSAGAVNNTFSEPGPATRSVTDTESKLSLSGRYVVIPSGKAAPAWGDPQLVEGGTITRVAGRTIMLDIKQTTVATGTRAMFGFDANTAGSIDTGHAIFLNNDVLTITENNVSSSTGITLALNTVYSLAIVLRSTGAFYFIKGGVYTGWTLLWVGYAVNTAALYRLWMVNTTTGAVSYASDFRQLDLPWSDYSIATQQLNGARSAGDVFIHAPNCLIDWTVTTRADNQYLYFRAQDATNYWRVDVMADGSIALQEVVGGGATSRGTGAAGSIANGQRMVVVASGQTIQVYANSVLKITYASAANFATATAGKLLALGTGGAVSDIVSWPRAFLGIDYPVFQPNFP